MKMLPAEAIKKIERLLVACESEFGSGDLSFSDEEEVAEPSSDITFGMIRDAQYAIRILKETSS